MNKGPITAPQTPIAIATRKSEPPAGPTPEAFQSRCAALSRFGSLGVGLAYETVTANGGVRLVFGAVDTLEVVISRLGHRYLVTGHGPQEYTAESVAKAVAR